MTEMHGPGGPLPAIPDDLTLVQFMLDHQHPSRPSAAQSIAWLIDDATGRRVTVHEIRGRVQSLANGFRLRWNIVENDVIGIFSPNHIDYPVAIWAAHRLGAILTTSNPTFTVDELKYQLDLTKAKAIVVHPSNLLVALEAARAVGIPPEYIIVFDVPGLASGSQTTINEIIGEGMTKPLSFTERRLNPGEARTKLACLSMSSGTTGKPKAVCIPHVSPIANVIMMAHAANLQTAPLEERKYRPGDVAMAMLPFFHIYGLVVVMHFAIFYGMTLVVIPKFSFPDMLKSIERHSINYIPVVPPVVVLLCKHPDVPKYDLSSLRALKSGAAPLTAELIKQLSERFPRMSIGQSYGMTETCTTVTFPQLDMHIGTPGSAGRLLPGVRAKVVDPDGKLLGYGEPGQLVVWSPANSLGYLSNEQATKETFADGWIYTGDEVVINEQKDVFVVDRIKELLKVRGFQVAPAELEGHLLDHPDVTDVCVVGLPDEYSGEIPLAFVVPTAAAVERMKRDSREEARTRQSIMKVSTRTTLTIGGGCPIFFRSNIARSGFMLEPAREKVGVAQAEA
ncbi:amp dependent CoA ligase [Fomitopsis betulina]|nr:amp dependent CoA ligase [Fomitopsis betulina]